MAKTESTAVNELIDLVQNNKQAATAEPAADLFSAPSPAPQSTRVSPPRMTSPVPAMRGAGEIAPLPRGRAPHATSQQGMPALPPPVRVTTADPQLGNSIPPLSRPPVNPRASAPALPQPRAPRATGSVSTRATTPPPPAPRATSVPPVPPTSAPIAAPFEARTNENPFGAVPQQFPVIAHPSTVDPAGDVVRGDPWFESPVRVPKSERTTAIVNSQETLALIKKLILPSLIVATIGAMIGAYIAIGTKKKKTTAVATARVEMAATPTRAPAPAPAAAGADTAADVARVEPPTKAEEVAKAEEAAKAEAAGTESMIPAATAAAIMPGAAEAATAPAPAAAAAAAPAPVPAAAPAADSASQAAVVGPASPPPVREVITTRGVVKLVDVRIDSTPSGATVMLVDNGKTSFLGSTPLATSLDPSRTYDVIFTLPDRPTQMASLDPAHTSRLEVKLERAKSERTKSERTKKRSAATSNPLGDVVETRQVETAKKADKPEKKAAEPAGEGTLMVSSKPPCEILIDGKPTGLTTPQRSIPLPAGTHKVTFVNAAEGIQKTVSVTITADQPTKLIQDLMKK